MGPLSVKTAIELYSKMLRLPFSGIAEIGQLKWRLEHSWRGPDLEPAIAFLQANLMLGNAEESREVAQNIWDRRHTLSVPATAVFLRQLPGLGWYERAMEACAVLPQAQYVSPHIVAGTVWRAAMWCGDLDVATDVGIWDVYDFRTALKKADLLPHFTEHQRIVRSIVGDQQCFQQILMPYTKEGKELGQMIYIDADEDERQQLEEDIVRALNNPAWAPLVTTRVLDITSHGTLVKEEG